MASGGEPGEHAAVGPFSAGDKVHYWSASVSKWIVARVVKANADGSYDLNCKKKVPSSKVLEIDLSRAHCQGRDGSPEGAAAAEPEPPAPAKALAAKGKAAS